MLTVDRRVEAKAGREVNADALRPHPPHRHAACRGLLHPARGPARRDRRAGPAGVHLRRARQGDRPLAPTSAARSSPTRSAAGSASPTSTGPRRSSPTRRRRSTPPSRSRTAPGRRAPMHVLPDAGHAAAGRSSRPAPNAVQRPAASSSAPRRCSTIDGYEAQLRHQAVRPADRLGLVLLASPSRCSSLLDIIFQLRRQFRRRHPDRHRDRQGGVLPAGQQELLLDGQDEGRAAADGAR